MTDTTPLFSTAYCPPISYFALLAKHENIRIEQHETFPKQTFRNRAFILSPNGILPLCVPVVRTNGNHTLTKEMEITYAENWNIKHWRTITTAYNASPYFLYYKDPLEKILMTKHQRLIDLNSDLLNFFITKMKIGTHVSLSSDYTPESCLTTDYRNTLSAKEGKYQIEMPEYNQVFSTKYPFQPNLSILDLLFNLGPDSKAYLQRL